MLKTTCLYTVMTAIILLTGGCATERYIYPTIPETPRKNLVLKPPVIATVYDGRVIQKPKNAALQLQADLKRIYGPAIEWSEHPADTLTDRVAVRVRIITLGASYGSRLISTTAYADAVKAAHANAHGMWGPVVGSVLGQLSVLPESFSAEGWWDGAAWIDLEVLDYRGLKPVRFTIPLAAEHRESNLSRSVSGDKAAGIAWQRVSAQLTGAMDAIFGILQDQDQAR